MTQQPRNREFSSWLGGLTAETQLVAGQVYRGDKRQADEIELAWFAVVSPEDDLPSLHRFASFDLLAEFVKQMQRRPGIFLFPFWGAVARLSKGPLRFLVHPDGTNVPLFDMPVPGSAELDETYQFTSPPDLPASEVTQLDIGGHVIQLAEEREGTAGPAYEDDYTDEFEEYEFVEGTDTGEDSDEEEQEED